MIRKIYINDIPYTFREDSLQINEQVNERSTCSFVVVCTQNEVIKKGMKVEILDELGTVMFRGHVDSAKSKDYRLGNRQYSVQCIDFHYLVDKRVWSRGFVETFSGDVVAQLVDEVLSGEGITLTPDSVQAGALLTAVSFNYEYANDILDKLCELNSFVWYVDYDKVLWFIDPKTVDYENVITDEIIKNDTLEIDDANAKYRNKQYIKGATGTTDVLTQEFKGDGRNQAFSLGYQLYEKPDIYINGNKVHYDDIVVKGYNDTAKWFYAKGDNIILQNENHTPLGANDVLKIVYIGSYPIVASTTNQFEVINQQNISGGTGLVEIVDKVNGIDDMQQAVQLAVSKLKMYSQENIKVTFTTFDTRFKVGELISFDIPELKDTGFVIEKIDKVDNRSLIWHKITAVKGPLYNSWAKVFAKGFESSQPTVNESLDVETAVLSKYFEKTWSETDDPNIMKTLFPSDSIFPSDNIKPMFEYDKRVVYLTIIDENDKVLFKCHRMIQSGSNTSTIETLFYVNPFDAVGSWKKIRFYGGSDILIDERMIDLTKSSVEGVQIQRIDRKGW